MKVMNFRQLLFWWFLSLLVSKSSSVRECLKSGFSKYKVSWQKVPRSTSGLLWEKYISNFAVQREIKHSHLLRSVKTGVLDVQPECQFITSRHYFFRKFIFCCVSFSAQIWDIYQRILFLVSLGGNLELRNPILANSHFTVHIVTFYFSLMNVTPEVHIWQPSRGL